jgi:CRP/FNR family nitrogen fixation transcriptional regulator
MAISLARQAGEVISLPKNPSDMFSVVAHRLGITPAAARFEKHAEVYWEDGPADHVYQVVSGAIRNYKLLSDGRCQITAFYLPGDVFGYDSEDQRQTSADAIADTSVRTVKRRLLENAATSDLTVAHYLLDLATENLKHQRDQIILLGRKTAAERVAAFLLEMDSRLKGDESMPLPMCRRDIGDYLGLTLETVSRVLSLLHGAGVLDFAGARHITLRNRTQLLSMEH